MKQWVVSQWKKSGGAPQRSDPPRGHALRPLQWRTEIEGARASARSAPRQQQVDGDRHQNQAQETLHGQRDRLHAANTARVDHDRN